MVRLATTQGFSPLAVALIRWSILACLLFGSLSIPKFRRLTRAKWPSVGDGARAFAVGLALFAPAHLMYYLALGKTSTVEGNVLGTSAPLWTALLAFILLRERIGARRWGAIALGIAGAYLVSVGPRLPELARGNTEGNLLYLAGVLSESVASVFAASLVRRASGLTVLAFQVLGAVAAFALGPVLLPAVLPFEVASPTPVALGAVGYLILLPGMLCFSVWYTLVERFPLSLMIVSLLLQPPLAALVAWLTIGEAPTADVAVGTLLILGALVLGATERRGSDASLSGAGGGDVAADEDREGEAGRDHHETCGVPSSAGEERPGKAT